MKLSENKDYINAVAKFMTFERSENPATTNSQDVVHAVLKAMELEAESRQSDRQRER